MRNLLLTICCLLVTAIVSANDLGKNTYQIACHNCHAPQFATAIKAPPAFDKKAWKARFKQASMEAKKNPAQFKTAMDYLLYRVKIGKGLMVHGGLCNEADVPNKNCSDEALAAAIDYMSH